jgi:hypothetical protein
MSSQSLSRPKLRTIAGTVLGAAFVVAITTAPGYGKVECDPNNEYTITPQAGAWMIIVQSYSGDPARENAHKLVIELRTKYDLPAYTFNHGKEERAKQDEEMKRRRDQQEEFLKQRGLVADMPFRMKHVRIEDQYAVLVGGYKDMDAARRALDHIRKLPPPAKELMDYACMGSLKQDKDNHIEGAYLNPFLRAFVVPNPTVPVDKPKEQADPMLKEMNSDESYSLFKCPKAWTLAVKEFYGDTKVVQKSVPTQMLEKLLGKGGPDGLNAGAMQAHEIAKVLRSHMNMDAYVLHTRHGSIVTVGAYDSKDDPRLLQNQRLLANLQMGPVIKFFPVPLPMEVPKAQ